MNGAIITSTYMTVQCIYISAPSMQTELYTQNCHITTLGLRQCHSATLSTPPHPTPPPLSLFSPAARGSPGPPQRHTVTPPLPLLLLLLVAHPVDVGGEWLERVEHDEVAAGKGVDEGGAVALSQHVQHAGLIEVDQIHHVLHLVKVGGVRLPG